MAAELLVVDDDEDLRWLVSETLEHAGHLVVGMPSADAALAHLDARAAAVSLIVLDWLLPGMPALDFIDALARRPLHATTPILVLTAHDRVAPTDGIAAVVLKPIRPKTLIDTVHALLTLPPRPLPVVERASGRVRATPTEPDRVTARTVAFRPPRVRRTSETR